MRQKTLFLTLIVAVVLSVGSVAFAWKPYVASSVGQGNTITIDGDLSDWKGAASIDLGIAEQEVRGSWQGVEDSSAKVYLKWTKDYLLLAADVTDDVAAASPGRIDNGDAVAITIDIYNGTRVDPFPFLVEMSPYPANNDWDNAVYFRYCSSWEVIPGSKTIVRAKKKADNSGYYLEGAIPFADLTREGRTFDPVKDLSVFFNILLTDCDDGSSRKSVLCHTGHPANPIKDWFKQPEEFAPLIFRGNGAGTVKIAP